MLRIRLRRVGKKKQPMYRIVVADSRAPRDGAFVEALGYYHPLDNPSTIVIDGERARLWLDRGAQPSDRVAKLLALQDIAELPPKLKARIELGQQRAKEAEAAAKAKPKAEAAEAPAAEAAQETPAEDEAAAEEAPAAEAPGEAPAEAGAAAEATAANEEQPESAGEPSEEAEASAEEAPTEEQAEEPEAAASEEEKAGA